jgi:hypothetical protein
MVEGSSMPPIPENEAIDQYQHSMTKSALLTQPITRQLSDPPNTLSNHSLTKHLTTRAVLEDDDKSDSPQVSLTEGLCKDILDAAHDLRPHLMSFWRQVQPVPQHCNKVEEESNEAPHRLPPCSPSQPHLRGRVQLSPRPGARKANTKPSVCCVDSTHMVLLGGENWEEQLVKIKLSHLTVSADAGDPCSFRIQISADASFGQDTRIFMCVPDQMARDKWLSALQERQVIIEGWDASTCYQPASVAKSCGGPLVTWLS